MRYWSERLLLLILAMVDYEVQAESLRHKEPSTSTPGMRQRTQEVEGIDDKYAFEQDDEYQEITEALRARVKAFTFTFEWPEDPLSEEKKEALDLYPIPQEDTVVDAVTKEDPVSTPLIEENTKNQSVAEIVPDEPKSNNNNGSSGATIFTIIDEDDDETEHADLSPWDGDAFHAFFPEKNGTQRNTTISVTDAISPTIPFPGQNTPEDANKPLPATALSPAPSASGLVFGPIQYVGNDHDGWFYDLYPLRVCKGDCDTDLDCQPGLYCHNRLAGEAVPHCTGGEEYTTSSADFCTWDSNGIFPPPDPPPKQPIGSFRFKLYWEEGYRWQNETVERHWCMIFDYNGYPGRGECWYGLETRECDPTQLYIGQCLKDDPRQWFTLVDVGTMYSHNNAHHEVLIRTVGDPERCLIRRSSEIYLTEDCDTRDARQRFFAVGGSFTPSLITKSRFEISQYQGYTHKNCITNAHHPKSGEVIQFHICDYARADDDQTSFWQLIY